MQTHANALMAGGSSSEPLNLQAAPGRLIRLSAVMPDGGHFMKWAAWPSTFHAIDHALSLGARCASASLVSHLREAA